MRRTTRALIVVAVLCGLATGWVNLHTDEPQGPMFRILVSTILLGMIRPRYAWGWGLLIGLGVPLSQLAAYLLGWRVPYPNGLRDVESSALALVPALLAACVGALIGRGFASGRGRLTE